MNLNYLQQRKDDTRLGVVELFHNAGLFYYISIKYTLKAIFGVPGIAELVDNDYYDEFFSVFLFNP